MNCGIPVAGALGKIALPGLSEVTSFFIAKFFLNLVLVFESPINPKFTRFCPSQYLKNKFIYLNRGGSYDNDNRNLNVICLEIPVKLVTPHSEYINFHFLEILNYIKSTVYLLQNSIQMFL